MEVPLYKSGRSPHNRERLKIGQENSPLGTIPAGRIPWQKGGEFWKKKQSPGKRDSGRSEKV
jgi:hypothetical protein